MTVTTGDLDVAFSLSSSVSSNVNISSETSLIFSAL